MTNKAYNNKDYKALFTEALNKAKNNGLLNVSETTIADIVNGVDIENMYSLFLSVYSEVLSEFYIDAEEIYEANDLSLATGHDLDVIGGKLGLPRYEATRASTTLQFSTNDTLTNVVTVPKGVECTGADGVIYVTDNSFSFNDTVDTVTVGATSKSTGKSTRVKTGSINTVLTSVAGLSNLSVTNTTASYGGRDGETDDDYRRRLRNWRQIEQKGNEYAYRNCLDNLDGLEDYRLVPKWDGAGTLKIITIPGTSSIRNNVYNTVQSEAVRFDEDLTIVGASEYDIEVYCTINVDYDVLNPYSLSEKQDIRLRTIQSIKDYVSSLGIGDDFIPFKCGVYLNKVIPELKDISFMLPSKPVIVNDESIISLTDVTVIIE